MKNDAIINVALPTFELFVVSKRGDLYELESKKFVVHAKTRGGDTFVREAHLPDSKSKEIVGTELQYLVSIGFRATKKEAWQAKLDTIDARIQDLKDSISKYKVELQKAQDAHDDIEANMYGL